MREPSRPRIIAHRALLQGPDDARANTLGALEDACANGFDVEFDVRLDPAGERLVLAHDAARWSAEHDASTFLAAGGPGLHALNVKELDAVEPALDVLEAAGRERDFFLFDFELLVDEPQEALGLMRDVQRRGGLVAHRLSEREPFLPQHLADETVSLVWLDELDGPWVHREHVEILEGAGKRCLYVSPELHGERDEERLEHRWQQLVDWGASGICTDYPIRLRDLVGGA